MRHFEAPVHCVVSVTHSLSQTEVDYAAQLAEGARKKHDLSYPSAIILTVSIDHPADETVIKTCIRLFRPRGLRLYSVTGNSTQAAAMLGAPSHHSVEMHVGELD